MSGPVNTDVSLVQDNNQTGKSSSTKQTTSELNLEIGSHITCSEPLELENEIVSEKVQNGPVEARAAKPNCIAAIAVERPTPEDSTKNYSCEQLESPTEGATMRSGLKQCVLPPEDDAGKSSSPEQTILELNPEVGTGSVYCEQLDQKQESGTEDVQNRLAETTEIDCVGYERSGQPPEDTTQYSCCERPNLPPTMKSSLEQSVSPSEEVALSSCPGLGILGPQVADEAKNPRRLGRGGKRTNARKGKFASKSSVECTRVLRSRFQEKSKAPEPTNILAEHGPNEEKKRKKRKNKCERIPVNEFLKIRNQLRYLLRRMSYEKNLIDAYSGEGWKGLSLEKVKLEKELERAESEIFHRKLKIRDLFQHLDLICAAGKLPEALFDSEGQIDSEDIFCAKCGCEDLRADNDIILCDGACERGFHQFCLEPPLLKEDIPPDDEGWLCPGCDCKVDCISLLNESQGTILSITDSWEVNYQKLHSLLLWDHG